MKKIFVKPVGELTVIDPATKAALPKDGAEVEQTTYWIRRLNAKEVVISTEQKTPAPKK